MQVVAPNLIQGKKVLLRLDLDVPIKDGKVAEDFRLKAAIPTLELCLEHAEQVIVLGHLGRPLKETPELSVGPIYHWLASRDGFEEALEKRKLKLLENLRFEKGEDEANLSYAQELASFGNFFVNEAFAAHHPAASTTVLPKLMLHAAGLRFAKEVARLTQVRLQPRRPLVAIIGGAKVEDKYPQVVALSKHCDTVLVGGLLAKQITEQGLEIARNVVLGKLNESGLDMAIVSLGAFCEILGDAHEVIWAGPVGRYEVPEGNHGNRILADTIINSNAYSVIGGGDTIAALDKLGLLDQLDFISTGGGAMLEFLSKGSLPTIEALE